MFILIVIWFIQVLIPLQFALEIVHAVFVILEVIFGFIALRTLSRYQISRFHYKQFDQSDNNNKDSDFNWMPDSKSRTNITTLHVSFY